MHSFWAVFVLHFQLKQFMIAQFNYFSEVVAAQRDRSDNGREQTLSSVIILN